MNLEEDTIASQVYRERKKHNWPGFATDTAKICQELKIQNYNETLQIRRTKKKLLKPAI